MRTGFPARIRAGLVAGAVTVLATGLSVAAADSAAATSAADIRIIGGNANSEVVCGNVAVAQDLAQQRHILLQRNNCSATSNGGNVTLDNVDIYVSRSAVARSRSNALLVALAADRDSAADAATCADHRPSPPGSVQLNRCWAVAHGGRLVLHNTRLVNHRSDGRTTSRTVANMALSNGHGSASASCANIVSHPLSQRDDCTAGGNGADWSLRGVDVVIHNPDGGTTTRRGINVEVRGGRATAGIYCFNITDGSGRVVQINVCSANAQGGDATLRNVTIHSVS